MENETKRSWGKVILGTRLEKVVDSHFFEVWMKLVYNRCADGFMSARGRPAHQNANKLVRMFLETDADSLLFIDSDAVIYPETIREMINLEEGQEFDILQAFYVRRGWPPEAIWFKRGSDGTMFRAMITDEMTGEVDAVGLHCTLVRREVFTRMLGDKDPKTFDWFYYPLGLDNGGEDVEFSENAQKLGFRMGATTKVKTGHLSVVVSGWDTYQEYLDTSGTKERTLKFKQLAIEIGEYLGEEPDAVMSKAIDGKDLVEAAWNKAKPQTPEECRAFYGTAADNAYFYDLVHWNCNEFYQQITAPLAKIENSDVLVIGGGIGGEVQQVIGRGNYVEVFELPGRLREYLKHRWGREVVILDSPRVEELPAGGHMLDAVVMVDTFEHVHPSEAPGVLMAILAMLKSGGHLICHNNFKQPGFPMHYDHSDLWDTFIQDFEQVAPTVWRKK